LHLQRVEHFPLARVMRAGERGFSRAIVRLSKQRREDALAAVLPFLSQQIT
jgi:hypothetical protein